MSFDSPPAAAAQDEVVWKSMKVRLILSRAKRESKDTAQIQMSPPGCWQPAGLIPI